MFGRKKSIADAAEEFGASTSKKATKAAKKAAAAAEKKAAKAAEKAERQAKADDKKVAKDNKKAAKNDKKAARDAKKATKEAKKAAKKAPPPGLIGTLTDPKTAKRAIAAAKVAGPVIAPIALRAATGLRGYLDDRKSMKLGVPVDDVSLYRGPTGPALARLNTLESSIDDLRRRRTDLQVARFADVSKGRLADLRTALQAAGSMPTGRRRSTVNAVNRELNGIDADLMTFLVGRAA